MTIQGNRAVLQVIKAVQWKKLKRKKLKWKKLKKKKVMFLKLLIFLFLIINTVNITYSCPEAFDDKNHKIRREVSDLSREEILEKLDSLPPEAGQFFTSKQLVVDWNAIYSNKFNRALRYQVLSFPGQDGRVYPRSNTVYFQKIGKYIKNIPVPFSPEELRQFPKGHEIHKLYGPLPHISPALLQHIKPLVITRLRKSIKLLSDKVEYMTTAQIQSLSEMQIVILAKYLEETRKVAELSSKQILHIILNSPDRMYSFSKETPSLFVPHISEIFSKSKKNKHIGQFWFGFSQSFPFSIIPLLSPSIFSINILENLKRHSWEHFLGLTPRQISEMEKPLQDYIVKERLDRFIREVRLYPETTRLYGKNITYKSIQEMTLEKRSDILKKLNLSEKNFNNFIAGHL